MSEAAQQVIIFDDYQIAGRPLYRDIACQATEAAGLTPVLFQEVKPATRHLYNRTDEVRAIITSFGRRQEGEFVYEFPALPLLKDAKFYGTPVALLSNRSDASKYLSPEATSTVVSKQPYDQIAPALQAWFKLLIAEPSKSS